MLCLMAYASFSLKNIPAGFSFQKDHIGVGRRQTIHRHSWTDYNLRLIKLQAIVYLHWVGFVPVDWR